MIPPLNRSILHEQARGRDLEGYCEAFQGQQDVANPFRVFRCCLDVVLTRNGDLRARNCGEIT